jgi:hypothetical protein
VMLTQLLASFRDCVAAVMREPLSCWGPCFCVRFFLLCRFCWNWLSAQHLAKPLPGSSIVPAVWVMYTRTVLRVAHAARGTALGSTLRSSRHFATLFRPRHSVATSRTFVASNLPTPASWYSPVSGLRHLARMAGSSSNNNDDDNDDDRNKKADGADSDAEVVTDESKGKFETSDSSKPDSSQPYVESNYLDQGDPGFDAEPEEITLTPDLKRSNSLYSPKVPVRPTATVEARCIACTMHNS